MRWIEQIRRLDTLELRRLALTALMGALLMALSLGFILACFIIIGMVY